MKTKIIFFLILSCIGIAAQRPLILKINTIVPNDSYPKRIMLYNKGEFDYQFKSTQNNAITGTGHSSAGYSIINFPQPGEYFLSISPTTPTFAFDMWKMQNMNLSETEKISELMQWGDIHWDSNLESAFSHCFSMRITATDIPDFSHVTSMKSMFSACFILDSIPNINQWNVSNVTDMMGLFNNCYIFNDDISSWDVSRVSDTSYMFLWNRKFNSDVSAWNVASLKKMKYMFGNAYEFNQDLSGWNVSGVEDMSGVFYNNLKFNSNISNWDVSNVSKMSQLFAGCSAFNQDLSSWDVSNVQLMDGMFLFASSFKAGVSGWNVSNVKTMQRMFSYATSFNDDLSSWDVSNVTDMSGLFYGASIFDNNISNWDVHNVRDMQWMFTYASAFNQPLDNWNVSKVTNMRIMFAVASRFNQNIASWDVSKVTDFEEMFYQAEDFNQDITNWNIASAVNIQSMFNSATSFDQNLGNLKLPPTIYMSDFLKNSGLSCENYSKTLMGWAQQNNLPFSKTLEADMLRYGDAGLFYRDKLKREKRWTFSGDVYDPSCTIELDTSNLPSKSLKIYPNPTSGQIFIKYDGKILNIKTFDAEGRLLKTEVEKKTVDLSSLKTGIYFIEIQTPDQTVQQKIIKK